MRVARLIHGDCMRTGKAARIRNAHVGWHRQDVLEPSVFGPESLFRIIFDIFFFSFFDYTRFARRYSHSVFSKIGKRIFRRKTRDIFSVIFVQLESTTDASLEKSVMQGKFGYIQENREAELHRV